MNHDIAESIVSGLYDDLRKVEASRNRMTLLAICGWAVSCLLLLFILFVAFK
jgi:hypothetical protein